LPIATETDAATSFGELRLECGSALSSFFLRPVGSCVFPFCCAALPSPRIAHPSGIGAHPQACRALQVGGSAHPPPHV